MGIHRPRARRFAPLIVAAALAVPLAALFTGTAASASAAHSVARNASRMTPAVGNPVSYVRLGKTLPSSSPVFSCQAPESATNPVPCYAPAQIRAAYNVPSNLTGAGETIVIIDAFQPPDIRSDLAAFDSTFGLPNPTLNIITPQGTPPFDPSSADQSSWAGEISLDVQWSHAIAPGATIDLVLAKSDQDADILAAQRYVIRHNLGDVLSQSFGEGESCMEPSIMTKTHQLFAVAAAERMTVFASSGDSGAAQADCNGDGNYFLSVSTPASDPLVTGVGATHLNADFTTGAYQSETTWNNSGNPFEEFGATGGGFSTIYSRPFYQAGIATHGARGVPDVAYNGDVYGGVLAVCSDCSDPATPGAVYIFGGTSAGSPQWAAITALADQAAGHRLGFLNATLYAIYHNRSLYGYAFHDVTTGTNSLDFTGVTGYSAGPGWDPTTGLGSPNAGHLIKLLSF
jgi:subtilase family serine protease